VIDLFKVKPGEAEGGKIRNVVRILGQLHYPDGHLPKGRDVAFAGLRKRAEMPRTRIHGFE